MAISQVIFNNSKLIDLTNDTVIPEGLQKGLTAHAANGELIVGTGSGGGDDYDIKILNVEDDCITLIQDELSYIDPIHYKNIKRLIPFDTFSKEFDRGLYGYYLNTNYETTERRNTDPASGFTQDYGYNFGLIIGKNINNYHALFAGYYSGMIPNYNYISMFTYFPNTDINVTDASYMFAEDSIITFERPLPSGSGAPNINTLNLNNLRKSSVKGVGSAGKIEIPKSITNTSHMFFNCGNLYVPVIYSDNIIDCSWMFHGCGYHRVTYNYMNNVIDYVNIYAKWFGTPLRIPNNAVNISGFYCNSTRNFTGIDKIVIPKSVRDASYLFSYLQVNNYNEYINGRNYDNANFDIELHDNIESMAYMFYHSNMPSTVKTIKIPNNIINMQGAFAYYNGGFTAVNSINILINSNNNRTFPDTVRDASYLFYMSYFVKGVPFINNNIFNFLGENISIYNMFGNYTYMFKNLYINGNNINAAELWGDSGAGPYLTNILIKGNDINIKALYGIYNGYSYGTPTINKSLDIQLYGSNIDASFLIYNKSSTNWNNVSINYFTFNGNNINLHKAFANSSIITINNFNIPLTNINNIDLSDMLNYATTRITKNHNRIVDEISGNDINLYDSGIFNIYNMFSDLNIIGNNMDFTNVLLDTGYNLNVRGNNIILCGNIVCGNNKTINIIGNNIIINEITTKYYNNVKTFIVGNNIKLLNQLYSYNSSTSEYRGFNLNIIGNNIYAFGLATSWNFINNNLSYYDSNTSNYFRYNYAYNIYVKGTYNLNFSCAFQRQYIINSSIYSNIIIEPDNKTKGFINCNFSNMAYYICGSYYSITLFPELNIIGDGLNLNSYWQHDILFNINNNTNNILIKGNNIDFGNYYFPFGLYFYNSNTNNYPITINIIGNNIYCRPLSTIYNRTSFSLNANVKNSNLAFALTHPYINSIKKYMNIHIIADNSNLYSIFNRASLLNTENSFINISGNNINLKYAFAESNFYLNTKVSISGNDIDMTEMFYKPQGGSIRTYLPISINMKINNSKLYKVYNYVNNWFPYPNNTFYINGKYEPLCLNISGNNIDFSNMFDGVGTLFYSRGCNVVLNINARNSNYCSMFNDRSVVIYGNVDIYLHDVSGIDNKSNMLVQSTGGNKRIYCTNFENVLNPFLWEHDNSYVSDIKGLNIGNVNVIPTNGNYASLGWNNVDNGYYNSSYKIYIYNNYE